MTAAAAGPTRETGGVSPCAADSAEGYPRDDRPLEAAAGDRYRERDDERGRVDGVPTSRASGLVEPNVLEAAASLPDDVDLASGPGDLDRDSDRTSDPGDLPSALEAIREIGRGQLGEDRLEPGAATLQDAVVRVDARGAVWADLAVSLVAAVGGYSASQLRTLGRLTTDGMFVLTVLDDVEDLPADVANGVANVPRALYDGDLSRCESATAVAEAFLASDAPERLEALLAERWAAIDDAARAFAESLDYPETRVLEAVRRALSWYCDAVCSVPVARTVPPERRRHFRSRLAGDEASTRRALEAGLADLPLDPAALPVDVDAIVDAAVDLPAAPLADVLAMGTHAALLADDAMSTSLTEALERLERRASAS